MNQPILYYIAAALFAVAGVLAFVNGGALGVKTILGMVMCGVMIWLGNRITTKSDAS